MKPITSFRDEYRFLSNFYPCTLYALASGRTYTFPSVEHAYQAMKTTKLKNWDKFTDKDMTPGQAKRAGKRQSPLRADWDDVKLHMMEFFVNNKFINDEDLEQKLLDTGDAELIEGNSWDDTYWGVCNGKGENNLGKILMRVREQIRLHHSRNVI